jgi:hypothetical protein
MRKLKPQLQRIDIDELFNNSSNRGMLSFLERPPEEAKSRLLEKQRVDEADTLRLAPVGELPPAGELPTATSGPVSPLPFPAEPANNSQLRVSDVSCDDESARLPVGDLPIGNLPLAVCYPLRESLLDVTHPLGTSLSQVADTAVRLNTERTASHPQGDLPRGRITQITDQLENAKQEQKTDAIHPEGKLPLGSTVLDGSVVGRRQRIRRATVAQDGHSSGEQLLYQSLWNAARAETPETRLISVGYNGMSTLCKLDKSNCKKNIQSLIEKLAVQVAETYQSASSTGTTYRIFSYREILRRREAAGMVWVIRTSGVRFVNPVSESPTPPVGALPTDPVGKAPTASMGKTPTPPVGETHTHLGKENKLKEITTTAIRIALNRYGLVDDDAIARLVKNCIVQAPDCSEEEIVHFIHEKGGLTKARDGRILNPIGFLIDAVPKCFAGDSFRQYRRARESTQHETVEGRMPTIAEQIQSLERLLEVLPDHPQNEELRGRLAELRKRQGTERG